MLRIINLSQEQLFFRTRWCLALPENSSQCYTTNLDGMRLQIYAWCVEAISTIAPHPVQNATSELCLGLWKLHLGLLELHFLMVVELVSMLMFVLSQLLECIGMYEHSALHKKCSASLKATFQFLEKVFWFVEKLLCKSDYRSKGQHQIIKMHTIIIPSGHQRSAWLSPI